LEAALSRSYTRFTAMAKVRRRKNRQGALHKGGRPEIPNSIRAKWLKRHIRVPIYQQIGPRPKKGMVLEYLFVLIGLVGLFLGGEGLVRGSVSIARRMAISPFVIGLTIVGFGTSTPELLVSLQAALREVPDLAIGNILGSNMANILLIGGITALLWPIAIKGGTLRRDAAVGLGAVVILLPIFWTGQISRLSGIFLFAGLVGYLVWTFLQPGEEFDDDLTSTPPMPVWLSVIWVIGGLAVLMLGAKFLVDGSVTIARHFGASEAFIGLTVVAVGTSLPELATSVIAALRRQSDIAIGNILGSGIFNVLGILGLTAIVHPIPVASRFLTFDLPVLVAVTFGFAVVLLNRPQIGRVLGSAMVLVYLGYIAAAQ
jgi:cation:H+ antiporter